MWVNARHQLVWLSDAGWAAAKAGVQGDDAVLTRWQENCWPVVVCRKAADAASDEICLGIALPPSPEQSGRRRIALRLAGPMINIADRMLMAQGLGMVLPVTPERWRAALKALDGTARKSGVFFFVYGSLAWQSITRQEYLTAGSDIDLLFFPKTRAQLQRGLDLLVSGAEALPLDGEIVFPSGRGVAWKEWRQALQAGGGGKVLVKEYAQVSLMSVAELLSTLRDE